AGGVATGWQTILRSKNVFGPYEEKIVLEQGSTTINGPHQGGWLSGADGREWFIHFQDKGAYGRIIHLQPLRWVNDWPAMGQDYDGNGVGEPVNEFVKPVLSKEVSVPQTTDEFNDKQLGLQWQWQANIVSSWYTLNNGLLRLMGMVQMDQRSLWMQPNLLLQKFPAENFSATTKLKLAIQGGKAGLTVFGLDYASLQIEYLPSKKYRISLRVCKDADKGTAEVQGSPEISAISPEVYFRVEIRKVQPSPKDPVRAICQFFYSSDGVNFKTIGAPFTAREGKWVGAKVGLFSTGKKGTYADFDWFRIAEL
ncbi:MAG TPA: glycoside hydrolase, partial [Haliscomenobacter sp.]|nr:glycoside hydrolase [Haliscomenobacter sp.]